MPSQVVQSAAASRWGHTRGGPHLPRRSPPAAKGPDRNDRSAFTIVELLVIVAIISVLVSILVPSLGKAKVLAVRALCATKLNTIRTASDQYAAEWRGFFPYRAGGSYLPHVFWHGGSFDLNQTFVRKYLETERQNIMFCPGDLYRARNPDAPGWQGPGGYGYRYVSYIYYNFHPAEGYGNWLTPEPYPDMATNIRADTKYPLWGCLTVDKHWAYLAHDCPQTPRTPLGQNATYLNGSTKWTEWDDMAPFWDDTAQDFYWPIVD